MDQGVIANFKAYYLRRTFTQAINTLDQNVDLTLRQFWKGFDIYQVIKNIGRAWGDITETAMRSVWKKVCSQIIPQVQDLEDQSFEELSGKILELARKLDVDVNQIDVEQ
ncbi:DDE superfamily endonuclease [Popillia japonica]|uniref:DDE superfamily endonuclease n=1 Tax=Popillia japonica TaxID=7064 RepID=A0AAW1MD01_POPJA